MSRLLPVAAAALVLAAAAPAHAATVEKGPAGDAFYTPPASLPAGAHGTPVWQRKLTGPAVLKSAKANTLLLYRSTSADGKGTVVSGTVAIPKGKAPKGGWPVVSWAHGTIGAADACAPSKIAMPAAYDQKLLNRWLKAGYAVVRTDYEGLGTPGPHPYLIGTSEGRSVLDMVRAARKLDDRIGKRVVFAGHSQGGHAVLFAGALARKWTPELTVRGTLAFAPASHLGEQGSLLRALTTPSGLSGLASMIVYGIDVANPSLGIQNLLGDRAKALYPQLEERCLAALGQPDSFGGVAPADLFRPDVDVAPIVAALNRDDDPEELTIRGPVLIEQGLADTTVLPNFTNNLVTDYKGRDARRDLQDLQGRRPRGRGAEHQDRERRVGLAEEALLEPAAEDEQQAPRRGERFVDGSLGLGRSVVRAACPRGAVQGDPSRYGPRRPWEIVRGSPSEMALLEHHRAVELARRWGLSANPWLSQVSGHPPCSALPQAANRSRMPGSDGGVLGPRP